MRIIRLLLLVGMILTLTTASECFSNAFRAEIRVSDGTTLPIYCYTPTSGASCRLPAVIVAAGVGATKILQYHEHCRLLADRNFFVVFMDPSNFPESMTPGPYSWDRGLGYLQGSLNQGLVAAKLAVTTDWYLRTIRAVVDFLCQNPGVDASRIAVSGFSQPANAALTYAASDPRIKAVVWNYGGWPWVMPYDPLRLPPVFILHGEQDEVYDVKYARELAFELRTNCRPYELHIYPNQKHMFATQYDLQRENRYMKPALLDAFERMVCFLYRTLQIQLPPAPLRTASSMRKQQRSLQSSPYR